MFQWLDFFKVAINGDPHCRKVLERYSRLIAEKRAKADLNKVIGDELVCLQHNIIFFVYSSSGLGKSAAYADGPFILEDSLAPQFTIDPFPA